MFRGFLILMVGLVFLGCGGDSSILTTHLDLTGTWLFEFEEFCDGGPYPVTLTLNIEQTGDTFSGKTPEGCEFQGTVSGRIAEWWTECREFHSDSPRLCRRWGLYRVQFLTDSFGEVVLVSAPLVCTVVTCRLTGSGTMVLR